MVFDEKRLHHIKSKLRVFGLNMKIFQPYQGITVTSFQFIVQ